MTARTSLRLATTGDIPALLAIIQHAVPHMHAQGNFQWDETYPNQGTLESHVFKNELWSLLVGEQIAGMVALTREHSPEYAEVGWNLDEPAIIVHRLVLHPDFWGQGLAKLLMLKAEELAREENRSVVRVDTNVENKSTHALFPKLGYTYAGEIGLGHRPGLRFSCFEKRLW